MKTSILTMVGTFFSLLIVTTAAYAESSVAGLSNVTNKAIVEKVISDGGQVHVSSVNLNNANLGGEMVVNSSVQIGTLTVKEAGKAIISSVDLQNTNINNLQYKSVTNVNGNIDVAEGRLLNIASASLHGVDVGGDVVLDLNANIKDDVTVGEGGTVLIGAVNIDGQEAAGGVATPTVTSPDLNMASQQANTPMASEQTGTPDVVFSSDMMVLSQRDPRWKNMKLGNSNLSIGDYGCYVTSLSMLTGKTPDEVNKIVTAAGGFTQGGLLRNEVAARALGLKYNLRSGSWKPNKDTIAEVRLNGNQHFVIWKTDGTVLDPWTGEQIKQSRYIPVSFREYNPA